MFVPRGRGPLSESAPAGRAAAGRLAGAGPDGRRAGGTARRGVAGEGGGWGGGRRLGSEAVKGRCMRARVKQFVRVRVCACAACAVREDWRGGGGGRGGRLVGRLQACVGWGGGGGRGGGFGRASAGFRARDYEKIRTREAIEK